MYACVFIFARICFLVFRYKYAFLWIASMHWKLSENYKHACRTNNPPTFKNKGRNYFNAITGTLYSVRRIRTSITK